MQKTWLTAILCLLYLSASTVFAAVHHHSGDELKGHSSQCAACAWHSEGVTDQPPIQTLVFAPQVALPSVPGVFFVCVSVEISLPHDRGPPLFLC